MKDSIQLRRKLSDIIRELKFIHDLQLEEKKEILAYELLKSEYKLKGQRDILEWVLRS